MTYSIDILNESNFKTSDWSGGKTTELAIYPYNAIYKKLNFKWRISSATVDLEKSIFTSLPNITRFITPLNGVLKLKHNSEELITLHPFEIHKFNGDCETISYGKVKDFNLMLGKDVSGSLSTVSLDSDTVELNLNPIDSENNFNEISEIFFSQDSSVKFGIGENEEVILHENELLLIHLDSQYNDFKITITPQNEQCTVLRSTIMY